MEWRERRRKPSLFYKAFACRKKVATAEQRHHHCPITFPTCYCSSWQANPPLSSPSPPPSSTCTGKPSPSSLGKKGPFLSRVCVRESHCASLSFSSSSALMSGTSSCASHHCSQRIRSSGGEHGFSRTVLANLFQFCKSPANSCSNQISVMVDSVNGKLGRLCSGHRWAKGKPNNKARARRTPSKELFESALGASMRLDGRPRVLDSTPSIRLATFNAAMFSMAPAVPGAGCGRPGQAVELDIQAKSANDRPKGILKERNKERPKMRVSINLPDNEISLGRTKQSNLVTLERDKAPIFASPSFDETEMVRSGRTVMDVLREVGADVVALQNVKAEEENGMKPLSELAEGLGMKYVFAESWAPEYGNAILSKWPIRRWKVQKISDVSDHRNVLKAAIDVPQAGEINFHCTYLDHLDENWRMKQMNNILKSSEGPHILAGGLNSLDEADYSEERWNDIVKYYEEIGKPTPKVEVTRFLKEKQYVDAKNFAGECEPVVVIAKGQDVQGTCKYGTRVDYIMASPDSPYRFVPGSYMVISSKGTSDHHIVKVDIRIVVDDKNGGHVRQSFKQNIVKTDKASSSKGI